MLVKSKYIKILLSLFVIIAIVAVSAGVRLDLFGAAKAKEEFVSQSAKNEIDKIFYQEKAQKIDSIMQIRAKKNYFNGNVLVAYKGNCIYNESFGYADMLRRSKLKKDDIFQLASVSKQFTAMAIMMLKEQNKLAYDDTVTKYIPEFPYPRITLRMLLNHTSGLPNYMWLVEHHWKGKKAPYNTDVVKMMNEHKLALYFTPGRRWDYSNTGYIILASIVERVTKVEFADFMKNNVFEPLQMNNSFVYSRSLSNAKKDRLRGYYYRSKRYRMIPETVNDGAVGDKGVYSTTEDLFKWDQALYNNTLVSYETLGEAISTFKLRNKYEIPYGFGFRIKTRNHKKVAYHHGKWNGFRTSILRYVEDTNTVIVLNHTSTSLNNTIIRDIQQILDDSSYVDLTQKVVASILDDGLESAVDFYFQHSYQKNPKLDTLRISEAGHMLYEMDKPVTANKLLLFRDMYVKGELDTNFMNDRNFLKALSIN